MIGGRFPSFQCKSCLKGKVRRNKYSLRGPEMYAKEKMGILNGDLNEPHAISVDGSK
jgi:hypothetical protein